MRLIRTRPTQQIIIKFAPHLGGQAFGIRVVIERGEKGLPRIELQHSDGAQAHGGP